MATLRRLHLTQIFLHKLGINKNIDRRKIIIFRKGTLNVCQEKLVVIEMNRTGTSGTFSSSPRHSHGACSHHFTNSKSHLQDLNLFCHGCDQKKPAALTGSSCFLHPHQLCQLSPGTDPQRQPGRQPPAPAGRAAIASQCTNSFLIALEQQLQEDD